MHAEAEVWVGHARSTSRQEPEQRLAVALDALYGWYERTEGMLANVLRDQEAMPILREIGAWGVAYLAELEELVVRGWALAGTAHGWSAVPSRARSTSARGAPCERATWPATTGLVRATAGR